MITHLVRYTPTSDDKRTDLKPIHLEYLTELYEAGTLIAAGLFTNKAGGYLLFNTDTYEETDSLIKADPYIINKARHYEIEAWDTSPFPLQLKQSN